jgi:hypothetical protein
MVSKRGSPDEYRRYNIGFSREFRYCLETGIDLLPTHDLSQMQVAMSETVNGLFASPNFGKPKNSRQPPVYL